MNTKKGPEPKRAFPKRDLNQSEWDVAEGNNRIYRMRRSYERNLKRLTENQPAEGVQVCKDFQNWLKVTRMMLFNLHKSVAEEAKCTSV